MTNQFARLGTLCVIAASVLVSGLSGCSSTAAPPAPVNTAGSGAGSSTGGTGGTGGGSAGTGGGSTLLLSGAPCTADTACVSGVCISNGTCAGNGMKAPGGSPCDAPTDCASGVCNATCGAGTSLTDGYSCALPTECVSGACTNGVCGTVQQGTGGAGGGGGTGGTGGGTAGASGSAGSAGSAGSGGGSTTGPSAGCGKQVLDEPSAYTTHPLTVTVDAEFQPDYTNREYFTWLPENYDPNKAYPLIFYGAGCGASGAEPQPAQDVFNNEAILVFLLQVEGCFQAGSSGTANSPDIPYFDMALNEIEQNYCVDQNRVFMSGYSSGAWFSVTLSCSHGDRLRGIAMAAGGQQPELPTCTGPVAALFFVSTGDTSNPIGGATGSGAARDRLLIENGCNTDPDTAVPWDERWPYCKKYIDCDANPVVFCDHGGGHSNGRPEGMATQGWWDFFMGLPPE